MSRPAVLIPALAALLLVGCGAGEREVAATAAPRAIATVEAAAAEPASSARRGRTIKVVRSQFGRILADASGQAVYVFDKETTAKPECYGDCARAWPCLLYTSPSPRDRS